MRDNSEGQVELVDAHERNGHFFGVVRVNGAGQTAAFEFGISAEGYSALKRVFNARPFDATPGLRYSYFFTGSYGREKLGAEPGAVSRTYRAGRTATAFEFSTPTTLLSNLLWFMELETLKSASALKRIE